MKSLILALSLMLFAFPASALTYKPGTKASDQNSSVAVVFIMVTSAFQSAGVPFIVVPTSDVAVQADISTLTQAERENLATSLVSLGGDLNITFAEDVVNVALGSEN